MPNTNKLIIEEIVEQHFEEAAFLWEQRDRAVCASNYSLADLIYLDERVEAHIDGLRVAGDHGWSLCEEGLSGDEPGTVFTATVIAFESGDQERIEMVIGVGSESPATFRAMVSGLGWMLQKQFNAIISSLVSSKTHRYRQLGIAACGVRRVNPRTHLDQAISSSDLSLKAQALQAAGELRRMDLLSKLQANFEAENDGCRFSAAKSAVLLADHTALETLSAFVLSQSEFTLPAMQIALRIAEPKIARNWLKTLSSNPGQRKLMLMGVGFTGDPAYIPMLIKQMASNDYARVAGLSFSTITGVDLVNAQLDREWPEDFQAGPNDDAEDDDVEIDADEDLPWPQVDLVKQWWEGNSGAFIAGTRYLGGHPITSENCDTILKNGNQYQRQAAALEIALNDPQATYFNTKACGHQQAKVL